MFKDKILCVIGLGYVGLPLAVEFGKKFETIGFDINQDRIVELNSHRDHTLEVSRKELLKASKLKYSYNIKDIKQANVYIVTVPTPIDENKNPDLTPLIKASEILASVINKGDVVIYESTVYPGATEEICIPIIEQNSDLKYNIDFYAGYSPERINPGDKEHRITTIKKVTSGSNDEIATFVDELYKTIIIAGTHKASSIRVAEAAKVIENTQRDLNIALINELAIIFNKLNIDTQEVLEAAGTKWNFLPFRPGLVGGHCIGVDPYYLTYKAQSVGYNPEIILAGRRINDGMGKYIVTELVKAMVKKRVHVSDSNVLLLGLTFKENCPDLRNTKVIDIINELKEYNVNIEVYDPWASTEEAKIEYNLDLIEYPVDHKYDAIIIAVAHNQFVEIGAKGLQKFLKNDGLIYDLKYLFDETETNIRL